MAEQLADGSDDISGVGWARAADARSRADGAKVEVCDASPYGRLDTAAAVVVTLSWLVGPGLPPLCDHTYSRCIYVCHHVWVQGQDTAAALVGVLFLERCSGTWSSISSNDFGCLYASK